MVRVLHVGLDVGRIPFIYLCRPEKGGDEVPDECGEEECAESQSNNRYKDIDILCIACRSIYITYSAASHRHCDA